jgi:X-X-X-Leu-X-X-Gly heptad repeat protein
MRKRRNVAWLVAVVVGLMLVPAIDASAAGRASAREQTQNHRISRVIAQARATALKVASVTQTLGNTNQVLADLGTAVSGIDTRVKTIEAGVPQVLDGLTKLAAAAQQLKDGLTTVGAGLQQAAAGLTSLKTLATSQEYGFGQLLTSTGGPPTAEAGSFVETPDIPDAVQQAQTTQQFVAQNNGVLIVLYGVRSNESDGTGAGNPAASCKVTVTNKAGTTQTTAANPSFGGLPFQPVPNKSAMTSTDPANAGFPFGLKQSGADADQTVTFASTVAVTAGDTYTVGLSCVDTSPSTTDPSA